METQAEVPYLCGTMTTTWKDRRVCRVSRVAVVWVMNASPMADEQRQLTRKEKGGPESQCPGRHYISQLQRGRAVKCEASE
jgi:hypothetical protein